MPIAANPQGAYLGAPLTKANANDKTGTHYDFNGIGGYFGVPTLADLNAIPCDPTLLNEDGYSSGQRRLSMRVRIMTTADRGREFVLDVDNYESLTPAQQLAALCDNASFVEQPRGGSADLSGVTGDVTFTGSVAAIGAGKVTADKLSADLKSPAPTVEGLRSLGTGANQAAPGSALANYVLKIAGYGLSQQNYTATEKSKLSGLPINPVIKVLYAGNTYTPDTTGTVSLPSPAKTKDSNKTFLFTSVPDDTIGNDDDVWIYPDLTKGTTAFYKKVNGKWQLAGVPAGGSGSTPTTPTTVTAIKFNSPASGATITAGTALTFSTTATVATGTTVSSVEFFNGNTGASLGIGNKNGTTYTLAYTPTAAGSLIVQAKLTDSAGGEDTASISITVQAATSTGTTPNVQFTSPAAGSSATVGNQLTLLASATPASGSGTTISKVEFFNVSTGASLGNGTKNGNSYSLLFTPQATGQIILQATATDSAGGTNDASVTINVGAQGQPAGPNDLTVNNTARTATFTPATGKSYSDYEFQILP
jgi:hypothetical protein